MPEGLVGARTLVWPLALCLMLSLRQQMVQCTPVTLVTEQLSDLFITRTYMNLHASRRHQVPTCFLTKLPLNSMVCLVQSRKPHCQPGPRPSHLHSPTDSSFRETRFTACEGSRLWTKKMNQRSHLPWWKETSLGMVNTQYRVQTMRYKTWNLYNC